MARCIDCGFLAKKSTDTHSRLPGHLEITREERADEYHASMMRVINVPSGTQETAAIACYRRSLFFPEWPSFQTLSASHNCPEWYEHIPDVLPRDHLMERRVFQLEEDRREFQRLLVQREQDFQQALSRGSNRLIWAAAILGALIGIAQLLAAFFATPDAHGSRWLWPPSPPNGMGVYL